jgi:metacaspase-1
VTAIIRGALTAGIAVSIALPVNTPELPPEPTKIALIVAIGTYADGTGWNPLATANDEKAIRTALKRQGFQDANIRTLANREATAPAIVSAFRDHLIKGAQASANGAVAVFHFSGHGHRITDDNGDEPDGYDEVLVAFDAPREPPPGYNGEKHVRDDRLNDLVRELRKTVGPNGDVIISLDSCYSGSAARSPMAAAAVRGEITPIGPPQGGRRGVDVASGFDELAAVDSSVGPYIVLSAAGHGERAWETSDTDNTAIGSLSLALSRALGAAGTATTYRALFEDVKRRMAAVVVNTPQIEGLQDRAIFGGLAITQEPFYTILGFDPPTLRARIAHGSLAGLFTGTRVAVHPPGTAVPKPETALATGTVVVGDPTEAVVQLENVIDPLKVPAGWMFVTEQSFGTLRAVVKIDPLPNAPWVARLTQALSAQPFVSVGADSPDFLVTQDRAAPSHVFLRAASDARVLVGPLDPADTSFVDKIAQRVKYATHNRYLRSLAMTAPGLNASLELTPCQLTCIDTDFGRKCDCVKDLEHRIFQPPGGDTTLAYGDGFRLRLRNKGTEPVYVSVLDLLPDGDLLLMWPDVNHAGDDNRLPPGADFAIARPWRVTPPAGLEVFKLVASRGQVDFRPIVSNGFRTGAARGPLDNLFVNAFEGARAEATLPVSSVQTQDIAVRIVEKRPQ